MFLLAFQSCKKESTSDNVDETEAVVSTDENIVINKRRGCGAGENSCIDIIIKYPTLKKYAERDKESIYDYIRGYLADFMVSDKPIQTKNLKAFLQESADAIAAVSTANGSAARYKFHSIYTPIYEGDQLVCLKNDYEVKEGGDEDYKGVGYSIFDIEASDIMPIEQMIDDEIAVKILVLNAIKQQENADLSTDISSLGYLISDRDFAVTNNIGITNDHMVFAYSPLEIANEEKGSIIIKKSKSELKPHLKASFLEKWQ